MRSPSSKRLRRLGAVVAALLVHGALLAALVLSSPQTPPPAATRAITVELVRSPATTARPETKRTAALDPPRSAPRLALRRPEVADTAPPSPLAPVASATDDGRALSRETLARALSGLADCDPAGLDRPEARRAGCRRRPAQAADATGPLMDRGARLYDRMYAHVGIMADVRRAENGGERASCRARSNIDSSCPNLLPDNLPKDFKLPRD